DLADLLRGDPVALGRAQPSEGSLRQDLLQAALTRLRHEQPRRVRADVDAGAAHRAQLGMMGPVSTTPAIAVQGLRKAYGEHEAVRGIDFAVGRGEVFGLLGPNGAGKTTTVEILEGYRARDGGEVSVLGFDPGRRPRAMRERVGVVLQQPGIYNHIRVREALAHFAGMYPHPRDADEVLSLIGL